MPEFNGLKLVSMDEILFRQVHPNFVHEGRVGSEAFRPSRKDEGKLSVALSSRTSAADAFMLHTEKLGFQSAGTWGLAVAEVERVGLEAFADPQDGDQAHGIINFVGIGRGRCEALSKLLVQHATKRGRLHPPE